jgi:hypothetical protein
MSPITRTKPTTNPTGDGADPCPTRALARRSCGDTFTMRGLRTDGDGPAAAGVGWDDDDAGGGWVPDDDAPPLPERGCVADPADPDASAVPLLRAGLVDGGAAGAGEPASAFGPCAAGGRAADVDVIVVVVGVGPATPGDAAPGDTLGAAPDPKAQPSILPGSG